MTPPQTALKSAEALEERRQTPQDEVNIAGILARAARENKPIDFLKLREGDDRAAIQAAVKAYGQYIIGYVSGSSDSMSGHKQKDIAIKRAESVKQGPLGPKERLVDTQNGLTRVNFDDLAELMSEYSISLEKVLEHHIQTLINRGFLDESERSRYAQKFEDIWIRLDEIKKIPKGFKPLLYIDDKTAIEWAGMIGLNNYHLRECGVDESPTGLARLIFIDPNGSTYKKEYRYLQPAQFIQMLTEGKECMFLEKKWPVKYKTGWFRSETKMESWMDQSLEARINAERPEWYPSVIFPDWRTKKSEAAKQEGRLSFGIGDYPGCTRPESEDFSVITCRLADPLPHHRRIIG